MWNECNCEVVWTFFGIGFLWDYYENWPWGPFILYMDFPGGASSKESACQCKRCQSDPWVRKISWRRKWHSTPVFLPGKFCSQRSLMGYSPWGHKESDTAEWLSMHILYISLNPLKIFIYLFLAMLCLRCCKGAFPVIESWGCSPAVVHGLFIVVASPVGEHDL